MKVIECDQGSPEWHRARAGVITASMFVEVRKRLKSGPNKGDHTSAAHNYAFKLAMERISGEPMDMGEFETYAMRRGHELEPEARLLHEERLGTMIQHAGFIVSDCGRFGASADGLINDDGGSEYKCLMAPDKIRPVLLDNDLSDYMDQIQGCMWISGREWWHYGLYCPFLKQVGLELTVIRVHADKEYIDALHADLIQFNALVDEYRRRLERRGGDASSIVLGGEAA